MPCDSIATLSCQIVIDHEKMVNFPKALDLLKSMLGASDVSTQKYGGSTYVYIGLGNETFTLSPYGEVKGGNRYDTTNLKKVKSAVEKLSQLVLVEIAKAKIQAMAKSTSKEQYLAGGGLLLTVDI